MNVSIEFEGWNHERALRMTRAIYYNVSRIFKIADRIMMLKDAGVAVLATNTWAAMQGRAALDALDGGQLAGVAAGLVGGNFAGNQRTQPVASHNLHQTKTNNPGQSLLTNWVST